MQNMQEFSTLPGFDRDADEQKAVVLGGVVYKGFRCCFMAQSYNAADKWAHAVALYNR
jgi:signal recognition particle subunit SRP68